MDIHMPNVTGLEAAMEIRQNEKTTSLHTPIIALTADIMPETKERVEASGMDDYLVKPVDEAMLIDIVSNHLIKPANKPKLKQPKIETIPKPVKKDVIRDIEQAISIAGGKPELAQKLFNQFCIDLPKQSKSIQDAANAQNWDELFEIAHSLRGAASICAAISINNIAQEIEVAAKEMAVKKIKNLLKQLDKAVKRTIN
jgi:two-component system sensor histidine kinase BarA